MRVDLINEVFASGRAAVSEEIRQEFQRYENRIAELQMQLGDVGRQLSDAVQEILNLRKFMPNQPCPEGTLPAQEITPPVVEITAFSGELKQVHPALVPTEAPKTEN